MKQTEVILCKDCRFNRGKICDYFLDTGGIDIVTGKKQNNKLFGTCNMLRKEQSYFYSSRVCGTKAKWFEPKPKSFWEKTMADFFK